MKQPRLPGTEKFKFSTSDKTITQNYTTLTNFKPRPFSISQPSKTDASPVYIFHSRTPSVPSQRELQPIATTLSVPSLARTESKRRAILPITCKKTSRMLSNTNVELSVDVADNIPDEGIKLTKRCLNSYRTPSCPNLETSAAKSLNSSKTSLDTYLRKRSLKNSTIQELPSNFDWKNIRASPSRLSVSCSSCSISSNEDSIWVLREEE